jgi:hypothetical protein
MKFVFFCYEFDVLEQKNRFFVAAILVAAKQHNIYNDYSQL